MTSLTIPHLPETIFTPIFGNESERFGQRNNRWAQTLFVGLTFRSQILIGRSNFIPLFLAKRSGSYRKAKWIMGLLPHQEQNASGCLCIRADSGGVDNRPSANGPLIYLSVEGRLDKAVEAARANGGKVLRARQKIGEHGFRAVVIDSEGNRIALHSTMA